MTERFIRSWYIDIVWAETIAREIDEPRSYNLNGIYDEPQIKSYRSKLAQKWS